MFAGQCYSITQKELLNYTINELIDNGYRFTIEEDNKEVFDEEEYTEY